MWMAVFTAWKAADRFSKIVSILAPLLILATAFFSVGYVWYNKGLNTAAVEIENYQTKIADLNTKVSKRQVVIQTRVVTEYKDKLVYIHDTTKHNGGLIDKVPTSTCTQTTLADGSVQTDVQLPTGWVDLYNASVKNIKLDGDKAANPIPSGVSPNQALKVIIDNNAVAYGWRTETEAWRSWYDQTKANYETAKTGN